MGWVLLTVLSFLYSGPRSYRLVIDNLLGHFLVGHLIHLLVAIVSGVVRATSAFHNRWGGSINEGIRRDNVQSSTQWTLVGLTHIIGSHRTSPARRRILSSRFSTTVLLSAAQDFVKLAAIFTRADRIALASSFYRLVDQPANVGRGPLTWLFALTLVTLACRMTVVLGDNAAPLVDNRQQILVHFFFIGRLIDAYRRS